MYVIYVCYTCVCYTYMVYTIYVNYTHIPYTTLDMFGILFACSVYYTPLPICI